MRTRPPTVVAFKSGKKSSVAKQPWNNDPSAEEDERSPEKTVMYYVNDGVYGSFNCILYDHAHCLPTLHKVRRPGGSRWWRGFPESPAAAVLTPPPTCSPPPARNGSQMRSGIPAASGGRRATVWIASWSCAACPTCSWATGWSLRTWGPTP